MAEDTSERIHQAGPVSPLVGVIVVLGLTLVLVGIIGLVLFDFSQDDSPPPEVAWTLDNGEVPLLMHGGGPTVECDRWRLHTDPEQSDTLCAYFASEMIQDGDSAILTLDDPEGDWLILDWYDQETGQWIEITRWEDPR